MDPQCRPKRRTTSLDSEVAPRRGVGERASECARRGDAGARRGGLRAGGLGEEEGDHAVADVPTDEAARVDDALIGGAREAAPEREVAGRRQATGERGRRLEVREQDRRRASGRLRDVLHAFEVPQIDADRDRCEHRHAGFGLHDQRGAGVPPRGVVDAHRRDEVGHRCADVHPVRRDRTCRRRVDGRELVDEVAERRVDELAQSVAASRRFGEDRSAEQREHLAHLVQGIRTASPLQSDVDASGPK